MISITAMPSSSLQVAQQIEDLRLDRDVERRGRLVGDQQLAARRRAPWRSSPAGACRRTAGADSRRARRSASGMPHLSQQLDGAVARRRARSGPRAARSVSAIWSPTVNTGLSDVIGSWKIMRDLAAADRAHASARRGAAGPRPRSRISPRGDRAGRRAMQSQDRQRGDALAASRTRRRCRAPRPRRRRSETSSTARHRQPLPTRNGARQVADREQRRDQDHRSRFRRGSSTSRSPSPSRLRPSTVIAMAMPGKQRSPTRPRGCSRGPRR